MVGGVTMRWGGLVAVRGLELHVAPGERMAILGPNGAGKTTVFNLITGIYRPTEGRIVFRGRDGEHSLVGKRPFQINALGIARTFQNIRLYHNMTVLENLLVAAHRRRGYGLRDAFLHTRRFRRREREMIEEAHALLETLGLADHAFSLAGSLPYGQQRRVEIARALSTDPLLLLLDEPAAGMNPAEADQLVELMQRLQEMFKVTILLIEHQMRVVMRACCRIQVMEFGRTIAEGPPEAIREDPRVIAAYLGQEQSHA